MMSNKWLRWIGLALVVGIVLIGSGAVAEGASTFNWKGGSGSPVDIWSASANWCEAGAPPVSGDTAILALPGSCSPTSSTTILDSAATSGVTHLAVTGSSPTKMRFHVKDKAFTTATLDLNDYADLDVDQNLTVTPGTGSARTTLSGNIWIDVAATKMFSAADTRVDGENAVLDLTTTGIFEMEDLVLDADTDNAQRFLKVVGGTITMHDPFAMLKLTSDDDADNRRAKLWVASGASFDWECDGDILITGGTSAAQRVELDIDNDFADFSSTTDFYVLPVITGHVEIDVAANKKITLPHLSLSGPCVLKVTGQGTLESTTNTCSVSCGCCP